MRKTETQTEEPTGTSAGSGEKSADYSGLKQPQLKALLDERGIEYPKGVVANAKLIELLQAADKASE
jgi:hypothetical protein